METIAAVSTGAGAAAINIVRVSGAGAVEIADKVFKSAALSSLKNAEHAKMYLGQILTDIVPDKGYAVCFFAPKSYTGEDLVEFHCHGGQLVADAVFSALISAGARPATKGEFTKRAFLNGKLSLADAEAIADMIHAESAAGLAAAGRLASGELTKTVKLIAKDVEAALAEVEASLDFPDETGDSAAEHALILAKASADKLDALISSYDAGRLAKGGLTVAIVGEPNVGKSSLLNALAKRDRAIVTDTPGTTRDVIEEKIEIKGVAVRLLDTAGIRDTAEKIEKMGVARAVDAAKTADIVLFVTECGRALNENEKTILKQLTAPVITVKNKCDVSRETFGINVSARTGEGLDALLAEIGAHLGNMDGGGLMVTNKRHHSAMLAARHALEAVIIGLAQNLPAECASEDLRAAYFALGEITGDTATENVINAVFERFCIGK